MSGDTPESLSELARKCRCLARGTSNPEVSRSLGEMADRYEAESRAAAARAEAPPAAG